MKIKLTNHSKRRMVERTNLNHKERRQLFRLAMIHGKCVQQIKDKKIHNYLASKQKFNSKARLYQGFVFIYSKNSHRLYTMYKLPNFLIEGENNGKK